jgi:hypothetical protein
MDRMIRQDFDRSISAEDIKEVILTRNASIHDLDGLSSFETAKKNYS